MGTSDGYMLKIHRIPGEGPVVFCQHGLEDSSATWMHLTDLTWKADVNLFLGQNFRGLIAAHEIAKVFPVLKESIFVVSSIFYASKEVYGQNNGRHIPDRNGSFFDSKPVAMEELSFMRGSWSLGSFSL